MKHITIAEKSLLIGDEATVALLSYAVTLSRADSADIVTLNAIGADGQDVVAAFVLDRGTGLIAESTVSALPEPDNSAEIARMRTAIRRIVSPPSALPDDSAREGHEEHFERAWAEPSAP